jgi:hypothetical protein
MPLGLPKNPKMSSLGLVLLAEEVRGVLVQVNRGGA